MIESLKQKVLNIKETQAQITLGASGLFDNSENFTEDQKKRLASILVKSDSVEKLLNDLLK